MKVLLYDGCLNLVSKSGVGQAYAHQKKALEASGIPLASDLNDSYDVLQLNLILPDSPLRAIEAKMHGKKVVYYAHSTMEDFKQSYKGSNLLAPLFKKWISFCYQQGDVIITPSEYSKNLLESYGLHSNIIALTNGIDLQVFQKSEEGAKRFREKYNLPIDKKVVLSVGHYIARKGILDFISLAKRMPWVQFIWFGYTNLDMIPAEIKKAILAAPENVLLPGYINGDDLRDAYSGSDLFLFLTYEETEGIVLSEAFAMEIPVLIRDIPIYENFKDGEEIYKGKTLEDFQWKIEKILNYELPALTEAGYKIAERKDINMVGLRLAEIYSTLQDGKKEEKKGILPHLWFYRHS